MAVQHKETMAAILREVRERETQEAADLDAKVEELAQRDHKAILKRKAAADAVLQAERDELDRQQQAKAAAELQDYQSRARDAYLRAGGAASDFAAEWPTLRDAHLQRQAQVGAEQQRRNFAALVRGLF